MLGACPPLWRLWGAWNSSTSWRLWGSSTLWRLWGPGLVHPEALGGLSTPGGPGGLVHPVEALGGLGFPSISSRLWEPGLVPPAEALGLVGSSTCHPPSRLPAVGWSICLLPEPRVGRLAGPPGVDVGGDACAGGSVDWRGHGRLCPRCRTSYCFSPRLAVRAWKPPGSSGSVFPA